MKQEHIPWNIYRNSGIDLLPRELPTTFDSISRRRTLWIPPKLDEPVGIITWAEAKKNMLKIICFFRGHIWKHKYYNWTEHCGRCSQGKTAWEVRKNLLKIKIIKFLSPFWIRRK